jgi:hypothetical protein
MARGARASTIVGRSLWAALFVLEAVGCVLVVPPIDHTSGHCSVLGETACASCLRESCQASIDACCGDASCAGEDGHSAILDALDECGTGSASGCAAGIGKGESTAAASVRACVTGTCKAACLGDAAVKVDWSCTVARTKDTDCATCIYDSCASAIGQCCDDSSCRKSSDLADDLGACVGGDKPGCTYMLTKSESGFEGKVRACIAKSCADRCMDDRPHQACSLESGGSYCSCTHAEKSSGPDCSVASLGGTCVLGEKGCTCGHYACSSGSSDSCTCDFRGEAGSGTSCRARWNDSVCCLRREDRGFSCSCKSYQSTCSATLGEYPVPSCDAEDAADALANVLVSTCSN